MDKDSEKDVDAVELNEDPSEEITEDNTQRYHFYIDIADIHKKLNIQSFTPEVPQHTNQKKKSNPSSYPNDGPTPFNTRHKNFENVSVLWETVKNSSRTKNKNRREDGKIKDLETTIGRQKLEIQETLQRKKEQENALHEKLNTLEEKNSILRRRKPIYRTSFKSAGNRIRKN